MEKITSAKNPVVRDMKAMSQRKGREAQGRFLVEGEKMIREALGCGLAIHDVLALESHADFAESLSGRGARVYQVPEGILSSVCDTKTPQGICASFDLPVPLALDEAPDILVALDGVQDPGNVAPSGARRTRRAFGAYCWAEAALTRFRRRCSGPPWARASGYPSCWRTTCPRLWSA